MKSYLIHMQQAPFATNLSLEMQELAFTLSAFAQDVTLLFSGNGNLQLLPHDQPIDGKDFTKAYAALELFEISKVYVDIKSIPEEFKKDQITIPYQTVDDIDNFKQRFDVVISQE